MNRLVSWLTKKQRQALQTEERASRIEYRVREIRKTVTVQHRNEMNISNLRPVNPVYDRIKGRPQ